MNLMIINQCAQKQWHIKESLKECSKESVLQITISKHDLGKNIDRSVTGSGRTYIEPPLWGDPRGTGV